MVSTFTSLKKNGLLRVVLMLLLASGIWQNTNAQCSWTTSVAVPAPFLDEPITTVGNELFLFGGVSNGALVATSYKFNGTTWTPITNMPAALEYSTAVTDGTNAYIFGGATAVAGVNSNALYRYNVATNNYTTLAPSTVATWGQAGVFLNGRIYKIGGTTAVAGVYSNALEIYNVATNTWTPGAPVPVAASFMSAFTDGTNIYVAGGIGAAASNKAYRYNVATNTWDDAAMADLPVDRWGSAHGFYNGRYIMAGGYVAGVMSATVVSYDPASDTWSTLPDMPEARARFNGAVLNGNFHVIGGRSLASAGFNGTSTNYRLTCPPVVCVPTNATAPVIAGPASACAGSSVTLSVVGGSLNGAAQWRWYTASCGGTLVGTGSSISVSPAATTTYYVRGEGGCAPAAGPCGTKVVTVTNCSCVSPDAATICSGAIQRLSVTTPAVLPTTTFSSNTPFTIPSSGPATPYPSAIPVAGLTSGARVQSVTITGMNHTWTNDIDIVLVSPTGVAVILMSDVGGANDLVNNTYTFRDGSPVMTTGINANGTYRPTNLEAGADNFPAPGPGSLTQANPLLSGFGTGAANGNWSLYVVDDTGGDVGTITGGWSITFETVPTAVWTGGTFFTDPAATIPYVAGTEANEVYVMPTATTTYTATITGGPCAGANNITVTVIPRPTVTLTPASACGPVKLRAAGADFYSFSPNVGLSSVGGDSAIANPTVTTTYTVTGTSLNGCQSTATAVVNSAPTASVIAPVAGATFQINEGFETVLPTGWSRVNNSTPPLGVTQWVQGNGATVFPAFNGTPNSFAWANFNATTGTTGTETLSAWMISPVVNIQNGDVVSFYTRTIAQSFPDRLQVRMSTAGASTNVGTTPTSVGDFTILLSEVNAAQTPTGYPLAWTKFTGTVTGLAAPTTGRIAFRYFVTNGGPNGANSDNIGVDQVEYATPAATICPNVVSNLAVNITGGVGPYTVVYSNGTTNTTINNYTSGGLIQVSPGATSTYTIVSVTGANGCVGTGNTGAATVTVTPPPAITTQPAVGTACIGGNTTFTVASTPVLGNTFQWQVSTDGGTTYTDITNAPPYSGATTSTLTITGATAALSNNRYRVRIVGSCGTVTSNGAAILTVNAPAVITTQPVATAVCAVGSDNGSASFTVAATGNGLTYQWQVGTGTPTVWTNITDGGIYSGTTTNTLTLSNVPANTPANLYRVLVSSGGCAAVASTPAALTAVNAAPVVVVSANPFTALMPGMTTTLSAAVSPNPGATYQWFLNGVPVTGATANTLAVDVDGLGDYTVVVTDVNGCMRTSQALNISDSASDMVFIYPSPNTGQFQVRFRSQQGNSILPRMVNIYDSKGARIYSRSYPISVPYERLDVDLRNHGKGIYMVELADRNGARIKAGRVLVL